MAGDIRIVRRSNAPPRYARPNRAWVNQWRPGVMVSFVGSSPRMIWPVTRAANMGTGPGVAVSPNSQTRIADLNNAQWIGWNGMLDYMPGLSTANNPVTMVVRMARVGINSEFDTSGAVIGIHNGNNGFLSLDCGANTSATGYMFINNDAAGRFTLSTSFYSSVRAFTTFALVSGGTGGREMEIYENGVSLGTNTATTDRGINASVTDLRFNFNVGRLQSTTYCGAAKPVDGFIFPRRLNATEIAALSNPATRWDMYDRPLRGVTIYQPPAAGGGSIAPHAMHHLRTMHAA